MNTDMRTNMIIKKKIFDYADKRSEDVVHIGFGIDIRFAIGVGVLVTSILMNNLGKEFYFHIFTDSLREEDENRFKRLAKKYHTKIFVYYFNNEEVDKLPGGFTGSKATCYRLIIPEVLYGDVDKLLYLDADVICLGKIDDMIKMDFMEKTALVVLDVKDTMKYAKMILNFQKEEYFNAGVVYIDILKWNREKVTEKALKILREGKTYKYLDQDVLNVVLQNEVLFIPKRYNYIYHLAYMNRREVPRDTVFVHLAGNTKPWQRWAQDHFFTKIWMKYKQNSPWEDVPIQEAVTYKQKKCMARSYWRNGKYISALLWYFKYSIKKIMK